MSDSWPKSVCPDTDCVVCTAPTASEPFREHVKAIHAEWMSLCADLSKGSADRIASDAKDFRSTIKDLETKNKELQAAVTKLTDERDCALSDSAAMRDQLVRAKQALASPVYSLSEARGAIETALDPLRANGSAEYFERLRYGEKKVVELMGTIDAAQKNLWCWANTHDKTLPDAVRWIVDAHDEVWKELEETRHNLTKVAKFVGCLHQCSMECDTYECALQGILRLETALIELSGFQPTDEKMAIVNRALKHTETPCEACDGKTPCGTYTDVRAYAKTLTEKPHDHDHGSPSSGA